MPQNSPSLQPTSNTSSFECPNCGLYSPLADELIGLREQVITDPLTGLFNVRHFRTALDIELERTLRTTIPTSLMMIDLDHFKQVNDQWGHEVGNQVLKLTARLIKQVTRQLDIQCRYGGEEFVIILPETEIKDVIPVMEKTREMISRLPFHFRDEKVQITMSFGVSEFQDKSTAAEIFDLADKALYKAKQNGRNRVEVYGGDE